MVAKSPEVTRYIGVLQRLCYLRHRSDCYRLVRPVVGREFHPLNIDAFARHTRKVTLTDVLVGPSPEFFTLGRTHQHIG